MYTTSQREKTVQVGGVFGEKGASPAPAGFRRDLEGLRGIAILLVVAYHARVPGWSGGFIGVDVFFVLSGYLITGLLVREAEEKGRISLVQFYARRARRLLPASALMLLVTVVASAVILSPIEQETVSRTARATAAYLSNAWFLAESSDYFAGSAEDNPLLHTWSLAVEEQFYLVWPFLVMLALAGRRSRRGLVAMMVGVTAVSLVGSVWLTEVDRPWAFFGSPARAWEFLAGGLASLLPAALLTARPGASRALGWLGIAAVLGAALWFSPDTTFPGVAALLPVLGTAAVLVAGVGAPGLGVGRVLDTPALQRCGQLSYSWYLWHWPVLLLVSALVPGLTLTGRVLGMLGALGISAAAHRLVENPIRFSRYLAPRPGLSLALAGVLTLAGVGLASAGRRVAVRAGSTPQQRAFSAAAKDSPRYLEAGCDLSGIDTEPKECVFGDSASRTTVVLFGDSHAAQWVPPLDRIAREHAWRLVLLTKGACPGASVTVFHATLGREFHECSTWREAALRRIVAERPAAVILSNSMGYVAGPGRSGGVSRLTESEWREGNRRTLATLDRAGIPSVLLRDSPRPGIHVPTCLARAAVRGRNEQESCALDRTLALDPAVFRAEREAAAGLPSARVVDLSDAICDATLCRPMRKGMVVYKDTNHLTATFTASLTPVLEKWIVPVVSPRARG